MHRKYLHKFCKSSVVIFTYKEKKMSTFRNTRRDFLKQSIYLGAAAFTTTPLGKLFAAGSADSKTRMKFGLVTYLWGKDWDLPTLIANCEKTKLLGVELRTQHAHGVEANLDAQKRSEVKKRFDNSPVTLVGLGTNFDFHHTSRRSLERSIEGAKQYLKLSHDVGGTGVKVKPNNLPPDVPREKTIEQIGKSLNELGRFGADLGQQVRLEVHGQCAPLPIIKAIMDVADHPNVGVCWNCNGEDLQGQGLEYNFNLVKGRFGDTVHVRELNMDDYPYQELINLLTAMDYSGWILLEARTDPQDKIAALNEQREVWNQMLAKAQSSKPKTTAGVNIIERENKVTVEINGNLFTEYIYRGDTKRPYFYPVIGPTGVAVNRHWPMNPDLDKGSDRFDHPHHKSLWYTHGSINGIDFWTSGDRNGNVVHDKFIKIESGKDIGIIQSQNKYVAPEGNIVCTDTRTHKFYNRTDGQMMDFEVTFHASEGEVVLGDTKEGSMAIRLAPTMRLVGSVGQGHIINSEGVRDGETWGKRAAWCDYYGPVDGEIVGVAIFDHPQNPKHPTWWHVRDYGLFAANPFGVADFERKPRGTGNITIPPGENLTFKYRFFIHKGDNEQGKVAEHYSEYAATK
jgi:sugar phosphate isomerase/epimerase